MLLKKKITEEKRADFEDKIIQVRNVVKNFEIRGETVEVLKDVSFDVLEGEFVIIYGPSGSGKSTLLHAINGWEEPTSGEVLIEGQNLYFRDEDERARMCHKTIAIVNQTPYWVKSLNVLENIELPFLLSGHTKKEAERRAYELTSLLAMVNFKNYRPNDLSGGQQQRASLLRALMNSPKIILADEPTGNLDMMSSGLMMDLFADINARLGTTLIIVTHDLDLLRYATKRVHLIDGKI